MVNLSRIDSSGMLAPPRRGSFFSARPVRRGSILRKSRPGVCLKEHLEHSEGDVVVFRHACKMHA